MEKRWGKDEFFSIFGIRDALPHLENNGNTTYATVLTSLDTGEIRTLVMRLSKHQDEYRIKAYYLYHQNPEKNKIVKFLNIHCQEKDGSIVVDRAFWEGKSLNLTEDSNLFGLSRFVKMLFDSVAHKNEWVNVVELWRKISGDAGLEQKTQRRTWPGLYPNGDVKNLPSKQYDSTVEPVFPALFLPAILGVGPESYAGEKEKTHILNLYGAGASSQGSMLKYTYNRTPSSGNIRVSGTVTAYGPQGSEESSLYDVRIAPATGYASASLKSLTFLGVKIDLKNPQAVAATLKVIRNLNRTIRAGDHALIDDLKKAPHDRRYALPREIMLHTKAYNYLNAKVDPPRDGIMTFSAVGGNNTSAYVSDHDLHIGANQYVVGYDSRKEDGNIQSEGLMIDAGLLFHDVFDVAFFNAGKYLKHKYDKGHKPEREVSAILFTHRHKDHLGQLAYLVKCGYEVPPLIMTPISFYQLKREMTELGIKGENREAILSRCYIVNMIKDVNPSNPRSVKKTTIAGTKIEQWTEVLPGDQLGQYQYYPILKIGSFTVRVGPMPHSDPGMMFDIITPAGSHRHTGDYKIDDTILFGQPALKTWLNGHAPDSLSADSTGTTKEGRNPTEDDVRRSVIHEMENNKDKRFIFPMLGSNLARLTSLVAAMSQSGRDTLIVDGKAVEDLVRDADKAYGFKDWAKNIYGVKILMRTQTKKVDPYLLDPARNAEYALVVSGTQDEPLSSMNRAVRDLLPSNRYSLSDQDIVCFLQGVIPVGDNAWRRLQVKDYAKVFHGARVILPEAVSKEVDFLARGLKPEIKEDMQIFHSSGHNCREDSKFILEASKNPFLLPVHGGPGQLEEHVRLAQEAGSNAMILDGSSVVRIQRGRKVTPYQTTMSEFMGIKLHTPSREKFYLKGRFSVCVLPIQPPANNNGLKLLETFENNAREMADLNSRYEMAQTMPIFLSRTFNAVADNNYLQQKLPFGIEKYKKETVFADKNIHIIAAFDTETTGLNASRHRIREFALTAQDIETGDIIHRTQLFQKIPDYIIPSPQAMIVTGVSPQDLSEGDVSYEFIRKMNDEILGLKNLSASLTEGKSAAQEGKKKQKILMVAHNARFDHRFIAKEEGRNLKSNTRPQNSDKIITLDTRNLSRALAAYKPSKYQVHKNPETGFFDHTLKGLCDANQVPYDADQSHGAAYDTEPCLNLFWRQFDISSEIAGQMIINADSSTSHLLNDMMGMETGFNGPQPIFSYVSPFASRPAPQMGCFIATLDSERFVVVFNLKYDPEDYIHRPLKEILSLMQDKDSDVFEILDLRENPIVMPARIGLKARANGNIPEQTLDRRAGLIKRHLNYVDPEARWQTLGEKIDSLWLSHRDDIFRSRIVKGYPELYEPVHELDKKGATPEDGIGQILKMRSESYNTVNVAIHKMIRFYLVALEAQDLDIMSDIYQEIASFRSDLKSGMDTINNIHYDYRPKDLSANDRWRIEQMRKFIAYTSYLQAQKEISEMESDPLVLSRIVGDDPAKLSLLGSIKDWLSTKTDLLTLSEDTKNFVHPWRSVTRAQNSAGPVPEAA